MNPSVIELLFNRAKKHMYRHPASVVDGGIMVTTLVVAANVVAIQEMSRDKFMPATWRQELALANFEALDDAALLDAMVREIVRRLRDEKGRNYYAPSLGTGKDNFVDLVELELKRLKHSVEILAAGSAALVAVNHTATTHPGTKTFPAEAYGSCVEAWIAAAKEAGIEATCVARPDTAWRDEASYISPWRKNEPDYAYVAGLAGVVQVDDQRLVVVVTNASQRHHVIQCRALAAGDEQNLFVPVTPVNPVPVNA